MYNALSRRRGHDPQTTVLDRRTGAWLWSYARCTQIHLATPVMALRPGVLSRTNGRDARRPGVVGWDSRGVGERMRPL